MLNLTSMHVQSKYAYRFLVNETNRRTEFKFYWCYDLHVSGRLSAHHQEFLAVHRHWYIFADSMTVCYQEQDGAAVPSCSW
jgi:hypothetical protein